MHTSVRDADGESERVRMCVSEAGLNMLSVSRVGMCTRRPLLFKQPASSPSPWQRALQQRLPQQQWSRGAGGGGGESGSQGRSGEAPLQNTGLKVQLNMCVCVCLCAVRPYVCMCRVCVCVRESRRARESGCALDTIQGWIGGGGLERCGFVRRCKRLVDEMFTEYRAD